MAINIKGRPAIIYGRFSSKGQSQSRSQMRQIDDARSYAVEMGLELSDDAVYFDEGLSGYKGKHRESGELGRLLAALEAGVIKPGTVLIVESLDRLSREAPTTALQGVLYGLIERGLILVTLHDRQIYSQEVLNSPDGAGLIFLLIGHLQRANSEAEARSKRSKASWRYKEKMKAEGQVPRMKRPFWLDKDASVIEERAAVVRRIFDEYLNQHLGYLPIAFGLNRDNIPCPTGKGEWRASQVRRVLVAPAVIGLSGPHKIYPQVIDPQTFSAVQELIGSKRNAGPVRRGWTSALKGKIIKCHLCGSALRIHSSRNGSRTLYCRRSQAGVCEASGGINYRLATRFAVWSSLHAFTELEVERLRLQSPQSGDIAILERQIAEVDQIIVRLEKALEDLDDPTRIISRISQLQHDRRGLLNQLEEARKHVEIDLFEGLTEWRFNEMPEELRKALEDDDQRSAVSINSRLRRLDVTITWDGTLLRAGEIEAWRDYKSLVIKDYGRITQADNGTECLGGDWWFLSQTPSAVR